MLYRLVILALLIFDQKLLKGSSQTGELFLGLSLTQYPLRAFDPHQCFVDWTVSYVTNWDLQGGLDVEFKSSGSTYRYNNADLDGLRSLSSRLCKCCQVLRRAKGRNGHRTP
jgi:hypothetical protein